MTKPTKQVSSQNYLTSKKMCNHMGEEIWSIGHSLIAQTDRDQQKATVVYQKLLLQCECYVLLPPIFSSWWETELENKVLKISPFFYATHRWFFGSIMWSLYYTPQIVDFELLHQNCLLSTNDQYGRDLCNCVHPLLPKIILQPDPRLHKPWEHFQQWLS